MESNKYKYLSILSGVISLILCICSVVSMITVIHLIHTNDKSYDSLNLFLLLGSGIFLAILPFTLTLFIWTLSILYKGYVSNLAEHQIYNISKQIDLENDIEANKNITHLMLNGNQTDYSTGGFSRVSFFEENLQIINKIKFQELNWRVALVTFFGFLVLSVAIIILQWTILISTLDSIATSNKISLVVIQVSGSGFSFAIVLSITIFLFVLAYASGGELPYPLLLSYVFPITSVISTDGVENISGQKRRYWVLSERFYCKINTPKGDPKQLRYHLDRTITTWLITIIAIITTSFSILFFIEWFLIEESALNIPIPFTACKAKLCFDEDNTVYSLLQNCTLIPEIPFNSSIHELTCIRYYSLKELTITNFLFAAINAIVWYLAVIAFFKVTMTIQGVALTLFHYRYFKVTGGTVILTGCLFGLLIMIQSIIESEINFDLFQYLIVMIYLIIVGMITFMGKLVAVFPEVERSSAIVVSLKQYFRDKHRLGNKDNDYPASSLYCDETNRNGLNIKSPIKETQV